MTNLLDQKYTFLLGDWLKLLEDRCQCPQPGVFYINISWEAAMLERSSWSRRGTLKLNWSLLLITWTKKKPSRGKLCGHVKQKLRCLTTMSSNMFGGEKVRPLTLKTPDLLSSMEPLVLCVRAALLPVDMCSKESKCNNEEGGLSPNFSKKT